MSWFSLLSFIFLLLFIPRVAGSMRNMHLHVSDSRLPSELENNKINNLIISRRAPGHSLDLNVPGNISLLRFHGYRRPGVSLYSICVDCSPGYGRPQTVDISSDSNESTPSCLFSLALEMQPTSRSVELSDLYHSPVAVSSVELVFPRQRNAQPEVSTGACEVHLGWQEYRSTLSRRDGTTQCKSGNRLGGEMNVMIGLVATLITVVIIIFFVTGFYALRLRTKEKLRRLEQGLEQDSELKGKDLRGIVSGKTGSETLIVNPETSVALETEKGKLPAEGYTEGQTITMDPTASSFSTRTQTDTTKRDPGMPANPETSTIASNKSRRYGTQPPTSPPKEPIPPLPNALSVPSRTPIHDLYLSVTSSPAQSQESKMDNQRPRPSLAENPQRFQGTSYSESTPERVKQGHQRNDSSSDSSLTSYDTRSGRRRHCYSKQLPLLPSSVLSPVPVVAESRISTKHSTIQQPTGRFSTNNPKRQRNSRFASAPAFMQPIRESSLGSNSDVVTLPRLQAPPKSLQEHPKSIEDIRRRPRSRITVLREAKSSPGLGQSHSSQDVRSGVATQSSQAMRNYGGLEPIRHAETQERKREPIQASLGISYPRILLDVELSTGPTLGNIFSLSHDIVEPPDSLEVGASDETAEVKSPQVPAHGAIQANDGGASDGRTDLIRKDPRPPLPKPPSYERVTAHPTTPSVVEIAPLCVIRKRELPKPPTERLAGIQHTP